MKWKDVFEDPDMVGQTEYLAIHDAVASAVMDTESPDPQQTVSQEQRQRIAEMLGEIGSQAQRLSEALTEHLPVKKHWKACECGKVLLITERRDGKASGGKSLEFDWKRGTFTASRCLHSFPCPDCGRTVEWNDGSWQILSGPAEETPFIWLQEEEPEGSAKCGCRVVGDLRGRGAAVFLCPMHEAAPGIMRTLMERMPKRTPATARKRGVR